MKKLHCLAVCLLFSLFFQSLVAQNDPELTFTTYLSGFSSPVDIANAGDGTDRLFIVERSGTIKIIENNAVLSTPFLNISSRIQCCGERGLLGLVFHPDYSSNGYFYVNYTDNSGGDTRISRFSVSDADNDVADPDSELVLLEIDQPFGNHNAGDLNFGPTDGYLYIPLGDGGSGGDPGDRSQNGECLLGKMLRIDVDGGGLPSTSSQTTPCAFTSSNNYTIPSDNPFVGVTNPDILDEIWSIGLRNPWRFAFDSANGDMWTADVGQGAWEEVNYEENGAGGLNYGWRCYEGEHPYDLSGCGPAANYTDPVFEYDHTSSGGFSITGGCVYRGTDFPNLVGHYVLADYLSHNVWTIFKESNGTFTSIFHDIPGSHSVSTFGVDEDGEMYVANLNGTISKVEDTSPLPLELSSFTGKAERGINKLSWTTLTEMNTAYFEVERSDNGKDFYTIGKEAAAENSLEQLDYHFDDVKPLEANNFYRLKMVDQDETFRYSPVINIERGAPFSINIFPNPNDGKFTLYVNGEVSSAIDIQMYSSDGNPVLRERIDKNQRKKDFDLSGLVSDVYFIQVVSGQDVFTERMVVR